LPTIAIGAALVAVGIAAIALWKLRKAPAHAAEAAGPDLWDPAWKGMRVCVLGRDPASTDVAEAIAAVDLLAPERTCGAELVALARAAGGEAEWAGVRRGIAELADALGRHGQRRHQVVTMYTAPLKPDPLPGVFSTLEKAIERVRPPPMAPPAPVRVLPQLDARPLVVDGQVAATASTWRNTLYVSAGDAYRRPVRIIDGEVRWMAQPATYGEALWSPAATWQAYVEDAVTRAKVIVAGPTLDAATTIATVSAGSSYVWAAIGDGDARMLVFSDYATPYIARSTDAGAHWKKTRLPVGSNGYFGAAASADGKWLELVWATDGGTQRVVLDPTVHATGALPEADLISPAQTWIQCDTGALWLALYESDTEWVIRRANAGTPSGRFKTQPLLVACSADKLVLRVDEQEFGCDAAACGPLPKLPSAPLATVVGSDVLRYQTWENVIALWWGDKPPVFARMPGNRTVVGIVDDRGTAVAIFQTDSRVEHAVLPK
jgi:hypothetical protein